MPVALVLLAFGPALVVLGAALVGDRVELPEILPYDDYYGVIGVVVLVFVAMTTPELLCPDRRDRVLDLYLATAVSPFEYVLGKFLAALVPLLCLTFVPQFTLFVGNAIFDEDASATSATTSDIAAQDRRLRSPAGRLLLAARAWRSRRSPTGGRSPSAASSA